MTSIGPACNPDDISAFATAVVIIGAIFDGLGIAILYIASVTYAAICAAPMNRGFFFGFSYASICGAMAFADLITAGLVTSFDQD